MSLIHFLPVVSMIACFILAREKPANTNLFFSMVVVSFFGIGYAFWGFYRIRGVPQGLINPNDMTFVWQGLGLVVLGIIMYAILWLQDVRRRCPVN